MSTLALVTASSTISAVFTLSSAILALVTALEASLAEVIAASVICPVSKAAWKQPLPVAYTMAKSPSGTFVVVELAKRLPCRSVVVDEVHNFPTSGDG